MPSPPLLWACSNGVSPPEPVPGVREHASRSGPAAASRERRSERGAVPAPAFGSRRATAIDRPPAPTITASGAQAGRWSLASSSSDQALPDVACQRLAHNRSREAADSVLCIDLPLARRRAPNPARGAPPGRRRRDGAAADRVLRTPGMVHRLNRENVSQWGSSPTSLSPPHEAVLRSPSSRTRANGHRVGRYPASMPANSLGRSDEVISLNSLVFLTPLAAAPAT